MARDRNSDWLSRVTVPDVYPRKSDPYRPPSAPQPDFAIPAGEGGGLMTETGDDLYRNITTPGARPSVFQRSFNTTVQIGLGAQALVPNRFECDTIVICVPSTAANSVFLGFGSAVTTASGLECRAGLPVIITPDNTREQWEIQRCLEAIAAILANDRGMSPLPVYRAPRVVFNASEYFLIAGVAGPTSVAVMLFYTPEMQ